MIYDSFNGRANGARGYPLLTINNEFIYMAGISGPRPWVAKPSEMDVLRIMALYPRRQVPMFGHPIHQRSVRANDTSPGASSTESEQPWVNITIPGFTTTSAQSAPTDFPKFVNDSRALEIAEKYSVNHPNYVTEDELESE